MILTETNITDQAYFQNRMRYNMVLLQAIMMAGGEVQELMGLVIYDQPQVYSIDLTRFHKQNLVSCKVVSGGKWTPLIVSYPPPSILE